jgi:hypothetical protein
MTLTIPTIQLSRRLMLISFAFIFHAERVLASEPASDAQTQARDLLSGTVGGLTKTIGESFGISSNSNMALNLDPQGQARRLILAKPNVSGIAGRAHGVDPKKPTLPVAFTRSRGSTYADPQEAARRMIVGSKPGDTKDIPVATAAAN